MVQIISGALKRAPKENRKKAVVATKGFLGETGFIAALEKLLAALPRRSDHPWRKIIREQVGEAIYQKITDQLGTTAPNRVAEPQSPYSANGKMTQIGLFD